MRSEPREQADRHHSIECQTAPDGVRVVFDSSPMAVRAALQATLQGLGHLDLSPETAQTLELLLAEVMNNIVEHAYLDRADGRIEVTVAHVPGSLNCATYDDGAPLPGGVPLDPAPADTADEPEGGFGWLLIQALSSDIRYSRDGGRNRLTFRLDLGRALHAC